MHIEPFQTIALMSPLHPGRVATRRVGGGSSASYLEAWDVKATLIRIFGFGGFSAEVIDTRIVRAEQDVPTFTDRDKKNRKMDDEGNPAYNWAVTALCTVRLTVHDPHRERDAVYSESAVSMQTGPDHGEVTDFAVKTAESDALKRAAIYLGTQFGLSLYDNGKTTDIVRKVLAPGQREQDITDYRASIGQVPGTPDAPPADAVEKARQDIARATSAPRRQARTERTDQEISEDAAVAGGGE